MLLTDALAEGGLVAFDAELLRPTAPQYLTQISSARHGSGETQHAPGGDAAGLSRGGSSRGHRGKKHGRRRDKASRRRRTRHLADSDTETQDFVGETPNVKHPSG